jgi:hypothetical protein
VFWGVVVGLAIASGWLFTSWIASEGFEAKPIETHAFAEPIGETLFYSMTASGRSISFSVGSVIGVLMGATIGALVRGQFRWEACDDPTELKRQLLGAIIMGPSAILAVGCSIGQGISAFSLLTISAPLALGSIYFGASVGLRQLIWGYSSEL